MKSRARGDIIIDIKDSRGVEGFQTVDVEKENRNMIREVILTVKGNPLNLLDLVPEQCGKMPLVLVDGGKAFFFQPIEARLQTGDAEDIQSSIFQTVGILLKMTALGRPNSSASGAGKADFDSFPDIEPADTGGAEQGFMPGERYNVNIILFYVDGNLACSLRGINGKRDAHFPAISPDFSDRLDSADDVRSMVDDDQTGIFLEFLTKVIRVHESAGVEGNVINFNAPQLDR